ncbi:hypothetical protein [Sorangium cellulosum]|nr:hypothetical protein [Sorangium cellulosum]
MNVTYERDYLLLSHTAGAAGNAGQHCNAGARRESSEESDE